MKTPVKPTKEGISLNIYVQPGASKSAWAGVHDEAIKLRIQAKPVEGEANKAVCSFVAEYFGVSKSAVSIIHGQRGRSKTVLVCGPTDQLVARANELASER